MLPRPPLHPAGRLSGHRTSGRRNSSPINHLSCTPTTSGELRHKMEPGQSCSQGRFHLLPPAPHSRLNCRALRSSRIIHACLIKAVNGPIVKLEMCGTCSLGVPCQGLVVGSARCVCVGLPKCALTGFSTAVPATYAWFGKMTVRGLMPDTEWDRIPEGVFLALPARSCPPPRWKCWGDPSCVASERAY